MSNKEKKLQFEKKISFSSVVVLTLILFSYIVGFITPFSYLLLSKLPMPSYVHTYISVGIGIIGVIVTTLVSKVGVKEVVDKLISQEIDEGVKKINAQKELEIDFANYQKNIFINLSLEFISMLYKAFENSLEKINSYYRLNSKFWGDQLISINPKDISKFDTDNKYYNEASQMLITANEYQGKKLDILTYKI